MSIWANVQLHHPFILIAVSGLNSRDPMIVPECLEVPLPEMPAAPDKKA